MRVLSELQRLHGQILANLDELEALTALGEPPMHRLSAVRLALTRASRARTMLLDRLYPTLIAGAGAADRAVLERLRGEAKDNLVTSVNHIGNWTVREITARWADYCTASHALRAAMRDRIAREIAVVYPLLADRAA
ncbi:hypothetical protein [Sphingomonas sp. KR3-1]|uniref:hypothetical protein n=1 Tax=Sphingomonas sp. KR3-1 TaxID=3156611 RepID=UPI0032B33686